jgi:hypothetical protein
MDVSEERVRQQIKLCLLRTRYAYVTRLLQPAVVGDASRLSEHLSRTALVVPLVAAGHAVFAGVAAVIALGLAISLGNAGTQQEHRSCSHNQCRNSFHLHNLSVMQAPASCRGPLCRFEALRNILCINVPYMQHRAAT